MFSIVFNAHLSMSFPDQAALCGSCWPIYGGDLPLGRLEQISCVVGPILAPPFFFMTLVSGSTVPSTHHGLLVDRNDSLDASINRMPAESVARKVNLAIL